MWTRLTLILLLTPVLGVGGCAELCRGVAPCDGSSDAGPLLDGDLDSNGSDADSQEMDASVPDVDVPDVDVADVNIPDASCSHLAYCVSPEGAECADTSNDPRHCGDCNVVCEEGTQVCSEGECVNL